MAGPARIPTRLDSEREQRVPWRGPWLVRCPRCGACAHAEPERARIVCRGCSLVRAGRLAVGEDGRVCQVAGNDGRWRRDRKPGHSPAVREVEHDLWLREDCCEGQTLWALNAAHLASLERYVSAVLGGTAPQPVWRPQHRLPTWMKRREHRVEVLAAIARLRERLAASS